MTHRRQFVSLNAREVGTERSDTDNCSVMGAGSSLVLEDRLEGLEKSVAKSSLANRNSFGDKANCHGTRVCEHSPDHRG
jgi:hypothetical protein